MKLGPEVPLSPTDVVPAAFNQDSPRVASNGRDFLAVWADSWSHGGAVYASRLGPDARPLQPFGVKVADPASGPQVASAGGDDYLIAWGGRFSTSTTLVDENGRALGAPQIHDGRVPLALVSNGSTYLLVEGTISGPMRATILDLAGMRVKAIEASFGSHVWTGVRNGRYYIIDAPAGCQSGCSSVPVLHAINESGTTTRVELPFPALKPAITYSAAASDDRILLTSHHGTPDPAEYTIVDYSGNIVKTRTLLPQSVRAADAAWDGSEFLLLLGTSDGVFGQRISNEGGELGLPFVLGPSWPYFASNGSKDLLVWAHHPFSLFDDIFARSADNFADLAAAHEPATLISYSASAHRDVQLAHSPAAALAVWTADDQSIAGAFNGNRITVAPVTLYWRSPASVATGNRVFMVVWQQQMANARWQLVAKRIQIGSGAVDENPIVLEADLDSPRDNPGIAFDGSDFLVAVTETIVRVNEDGVILNRRTLGLPSWGESPRVVSNGSDFLALWALERSICSVCLPEWSLTVERIQRNGSAGILLPTPPIIARAAAGYELTLAAATGRDRTTVAWMYRNEQGSVIEVAQIGRDGKLVSGPSRLLVLPPVGLPSIALAWNGSEYVLAWVDSKIRAIRLNAYAQPIDVEPFDVAERSSVVSRVSVVPAPGGVMFAYTLLDENAGNVDRAFARTLEALASGPRRRAVRR